MSEKEVIETYYERLRQEMKTKGTYDPYLNGNSSYDSSIDSTNIIKRSEYSNYTVDTNCSMYKRG